MPKKRPKVPRNYVEKRPRDFESFLNQLGNTVSDMHDYIVKLDKYVAEKFSDMKQSDMTIQQRLENLNDQEDIDEIRKRLDSLNEKLNEAIIRIEENSKQN